MASRRAVLALILSATGICLRQAVAAQAPFVIVLIGPTGSGKTTQVEYLKRKYGIPTITIDDLITAHPEVMAKYSTPGLNQGSPQASSAVDELVRNEIKRIDVSRGFALDGYPSTKDQADHLAALLKQLKYPTPIVLQLDVSDDILRERLKKRRREDDTPPQIEQRLKDYHRELDMIRSYYPEANIWTIKGEPPIGEVSKTIDSILSDEIPKKAN